MSLPSVCVVASSAESADPCGRRLNSHEPPRLDAMNSNSATPGASAMIGITSTLASAGRGRPGGPAAHSPELNLIERLWPCLRRPRIPWALPNSGGVW